ncbi:FUSC family protein [Streptomyces sp. WAC 04229]|uniref:FUSC family protein n=1 Tax=Streptomyces sp. WAC 04229 TaxID=2203206 RepID=UPI000F745A0C|nr:FUSC family protein [Streptomyces sp. WAC 04229]RSN64463.1 FUSC family protein [Streptomyces sp. WAC 04229]
MRRLPSLTRSFGGSGRAVRVALAAAVGFYPAAYLMDRPVVALYALFTPIAFGVLSSLPGSGHHRASSVLRAAPAAAALVALGTALAVTTWAAAVGMLVVTLALTFGAACAPRLASVVPGLQLCYILACFPPYAPASLPERLLGLFFGAAALVVGELLLFPSPRRPSYAERVADALDLAAHTTRLLLRAESVDDGTARRLRTTGRELRFSRQPRGSRPTGAGRTDRALAQAGSAARRLLDQLAALGELPPAPADTASQTLLHGVAATCSDAAGVLRGGRSVRGAEFLEEMTARFLDERVREPEGRGVPPRALLRRRSTLLTVADSAVTLRTAAGLATGGGRTVPGLPHEQFWYARVPVVPLWLVRIRGNLTPRSVVFQNAVRTALGLALARLVAGSLDLSHGFWVLLSVLTLARTTAVGTWSAVRSAATGTLVGAVLAGALILGAGDAAAVYAGLLVPMMVIAFSVGPVGGPAWAQGLFTLVVSTAFAQISPVTWRLEEARLVDVLTGSVIGLLCGLLAWPAGARTEMRRSAAALLRATAPVVRNTAGSVVGQGAAPRAHPSERPTTGSLWPVLHRLRIAEAAYAQFRTELALRPDDDGPDWLAALGYGSRVLSGAYWLPPARGAPDLPTGARQWAETASRQVAAAALRAADLPPRGVRFRVAPLPPVVPSTTSPGALSVLVDLEVWLHSLAADLATATGAEDRPATADGTPSTRA